VLEGLEAARRAHPAGRTLMATQPGTRRNVMLVRDLPDDAA